jgi:hypothetical protein
MSNKNINNKEIAKNIYVHKTKDMQNKFWMLKCNPITGFPPERLIYKYKPKPTEHDN